MIGRIFTVGGFTLLSRLTGFARDIVLAAVLGAGPIADAFFVALRLPNHFRAIFAEGAFNAAFVPAAGARRAACAACAAPAASASVQVKPAARGTDPSSPSIDRRYSGAYQQLQLAVLVEAGNAVGHAGVGAEAERHTGRV